jgi:hypothetical protein
MCARLESAQVALAKSGLTWSGDSIEPSQGPRHGTVARRLVRICFLPSEPS